MAFKNKLNPTAAELREWAGDATAPEPTVDWDLLLPGGIGRDELGMYVDLASDATLPKASFFLRVLYEWVSLLARKEDFMHNRLTYDRWLEVARRVKDPAVKRWRHRARLIFQGAESFDYDQWWSRFRADGDPP